MSLEEHAGKVLFNMMPDVSMGIQSIPRTQVGSPKLETSSQHQIFMLRLHAKPLTFLSESYQIFTWNQI
jgi:hypothetical protein